VKYHSLVFLSIAILTVIPVTLCQAEDITAADMTNAIRSDLRHPYLFFSDEDKPAMGERINSDSRYGDIMKRAEAEANRQLYTPVGNWVDIVKEQGKGGLTQFRRSCLSTAVNLAFVYQMTGDKQYADKAFEFADAVCDVPTWNGGDFHSFPIIYHRVWPRGADDDQVNFTYDIHVGDTARDMAVVYDWLYPALDTTQRDRIRGALIERAILLVRGNYDYHWWATAYRCNWCSVCFSGLGCAAMTLLTENPEFTDVFAASYNGISHYLDSFGVDGGWQEGCSYWSYGFPQCINFSEASRRVTDGRHNLFKHRTLAENTVNFPVYTMFPNYKSVYFCDSYSRRPGNTYILNRMASATGSGLAAWYRTNFFGGPGNIFDIIWPESTVTPVPPDHTSHHFRSIGWVVMRTDFITPDYAVVACKAGYHDDPHHGHLDCGNFTIQWKDREFISEVGLKGYDTVYFWQDRWENPQASSVGHNVVFVNGELQIPAKLKNKPWRENVGGKILEFRPGDDRDYTLMDPSGAYPGNELKGWRRHITYEKPVITVVLDEIAADRGDDIQVRFHSKCTTELRDNHVLITDNAGMMALIPVMKTEFTFKEDKHAFQRIREDTDFEWIPYFDVSMKARDERTVIGTIILPVDDADDAERIARSAKIESDTHGSVFISFIDNGKRYTYEYKPEEERYHRLGYAEITELKR